MELGFEGSQRRGRRCWKNACTRSRHFVPADAGDHLEAVIQEGIVERVHRRSERAGLRFGGPVYDAGDSGVHEGADAHQTRLDGDVHRRAGEAVVPERARPVAQRDNLGVRRRIRRRDGSVEAVRHDRTVDDQHGAHRHLARAAGQARLLDCQTHEGRVIHRTSSGDDTSPCSGRGPWAVGGGRWAVGRGRRGRGPD